ncbi:MAG: trypsin-like peptidase domain-containing protein [bacterium]|nr:trypsin-like peptidase domain-containing protein [bacterium]
MIQNLKSILVLLLGIALGVIVYSGTKYSNLNLGKISLNTNKTSPTETKTIYKEKSDIIDVVKKTNPSVVSIAIKQRNRNPFSSLELFEKNQGNQTKKEQGIGTGFIIAKNGIIITNRHVVENEGSYVVITNDNKKYDVKKVTLDSRNDLAIVIIDANNLPALELGDSSQLDVGQTVIAMGNQLGEFQNTVTVGIVSGLNRQISASDRTGTGAEQLSNVIQTDAAINPGSSGGPLLNLAGQVIGINTAVAPAGIAQNIGFAIPINLAKPVINEYIATGKITRPYIGVRYQVLTKRLALLNDLSEGAYIEEVVQGGPSDKAGLKSEDIITQIGDKKVNEDTPLSQVISELKVNTSLELKYYRENNLKSTQITIGQAGE